MKTWKLILQWIVILLTVGFLVYTLYDTWAQLSTYTFTISWGYFFLSYLFLFLHFLLIALAWGLLLRALQKPGVPMLAALRIRTISDFARFLPGRIWFIVARVKLCQKYKVSSAVVAVSALMESFLNILSTILLFLVIFFLIPQEILTRYAFYLLFFLPLPLILMHPRIFQPFLRFASRIMKKEYVPSQISYGYLLSLLSVFFLAWVLLGIGFYLMSYSLSPLDLSLLWPLTGVFAISWAAGFLVIILPGGLGLREAVMSYLLAFYLPWPVAILLALISRLWLVSGEMVTAFIFRFVK